MEREFSFKLQPKAIEDLNKIYQYSRLNFGRKRAEIYIRDLDKTFKSLSADPSLGRNCSYIRKPLNAFNINSHVIFYKPFENGINVLRILHKSMDYVRHFN